MQNIVFTLNTVAPVFLIVAVGYLLRRIGLMNENFINLSSKIVFSVSLPALIFVELSSSDFGKTFDPGQIVFIYAATFFSYLLSWLFAVLFVERKKDRGVFVQGSFRSNYAIVGLAIIASMFGKQALGKASLLLAFMIPIYNVLSVIALTLPLRDSKKINIKATALEILRNPLIIAVIAALPFTLFKIPVHPIIIDTGEYLGGIALPLALIGIGGSMNLENLKEASSLAFFATMLKIIIFPLILTYAAFLFGFSGNDLGIMFVLFACPTAIASFVMAEAMGSNGKLAGNIVLISTVGSVFTIVVGLFILKSTGLI